MKRIFIISKLVLIILFFSVSLKPKNDLYVELMYEVFNQEEAEEIALIHDLKLTHFSAYGFALYETSYETSLSLIEQGFVLNQTSFITRPWLPPTTTEDPYLKDQYALDHIYVTEAWTKTTGSPDLLIAIIDTGIDTDHEEFLGRLSPLSYNARTKEVGLSHVEDDEGHGTFVAGIIAANKDNSKGIAGIVQQGDLLIIKANNLDNLSTEENEAKSFSDSNIIEGIYYAVEQGADIINMSLGGSSPNTLVKNAVDYAYSQGVIIVAASGNDGENVALYPASYENVVSVGATDQNKIIASFSNYNEYIDLVAPGVEIISTDINNAYASGGGTSYAAPHVTGAIALMLAYFPTYTNDQIIAKLRSTATDLGETGFDPYYGDGLISLLLALEVSYVTVTFETNGGNIIEPMQVVKDMPFTVDDPIKDGHTFQGWYLDQSFTLPFIMTEDSLDQNQTLYAKYEINTYQVSFVAEGLSIPNVTLTHGTLYEPDPIDKTGYTFLGWYLDASFTQPYEPIEMTESITLYAKFNINTYTVTYYSQTEIIETETYNYGETPSLITPESTYPFIGWYIDPSYQTAYEQKPITAHLNLYARFDNDLKAVTFYEADHITVIETFYVELGASVTPPTAPIKPNTSIFIFTFKTWSSDTQNVTQDMNVYPIYDVDYIDGSITLAKGIDSISDFDDWVDGGLIIIDDSVTYEVNIESLNSTLYRITYDVIYEQKVMTEILRYVSIVPKPTLTMTLLPAVTTLYEGQVYKDTGILESYDDIEILYPTNFKDVGTHQIIYQITHQGQTYEKIRYVFVLEKDQMFEIDEAILSKESDVTNHAL
ncbi:MAG: hypothetical protein CVV61_01430 [Tenericutes bacterium HGW-Tenericutes-6]|nr:MAG: hypothetical protein CVV61_01430 [Tenericutes bacterium HGW-Tenericutes-6]